MSEDKQCCGNTKSTKVYISTFECFKQRFLVEKKSIFRFENSEIDCNDEQNQSDDCCVLTQQGINYLKEKFINNGYAGDAKSVEKFCHQLTGKQYDVKNPKNSIEPSDSDAEIKKQAIEILATAVWLWKLAPSNTSKQGRINAVNEIYSLAFDSIPNNTNIQFFNDSIKGFASPGMRYNMNKANELAYIILFFEQCLGSKECSNVGINCLPNMKGEVTIETTHNYSYTDKQKTQLDSPTTLQKQNTSTESASVYNALLHLLDSDHYEPILSKNHKEMIVDAFSDKLDNCKLQDTLDQKIKCIKESLECDSFYDDGIKEQWLPSILPAKNVIYYGAPGVGKTYELLKMIKAKAEEQDKDCSEKYYKIVQFHPSYNYEDFIDGVKPVNNDGQIQLELQNGVFKQMCIDAFEELRNANSKNKEPKQFYFIADEINRAELSRVFGELLVCLEEDKRLKYKKDEKGNAFLDGLLVKTQNGSLWETMHAVVTKENNNCDNGLYFGVPENIYFLGTMNDIDKSIDSFDLALRRRFKWVHKGCNYDVIANYLIENNVSDDEVVNYINNCKSLNKHINEKLGLGKSYELGHSYFMKLNIAKNGTVYKKSYENLFAYEIAPLLTEYLRAEFDLKGIDKEIKKMQAIFLKGDENSEVENGNDSDS